MALSVTELRAGTTFLLEGRAFEVLRYDHLKMGRGGAVIRLRIRNLETGAVVERTFKNNESVEEASLRERAVVFLYRDGGRLVFMDPASFEQESLNISQVGAQADFLTDGLEVTMLVVDDRPLGLKLPKKIDLEVIETAPNVKGATMSSVTKPAKLRSGITVAVPAFISIGDRVRVNTETGEYVERV